MSYRQSMEHQSNEKRAETLAKGQEYYKKHRDRIIKMNRIKEITQDIRFYLFWKMRRKNPLVKRATPPAGRLAGEPESFVCPFHIKRIPRVRSTFMMTSLA